MILLVAGIIVFLINLPFGFWRSKVKKFSVRWFLSIHAPVPLVYAIRIYAGISWHLVTFPVLIGSFFLGQFIGSRFNRLNKAVTE
ncbi:MAG: hypothetical protein HF314_16230 [Ignavibacteria bacterium]|jgi:hypothetical protein|nr:hypothetical protein [Ignavibacteria bacterium]MCU7504630.1 hypothetical protein [Ignavibacteria bacterium]MCU7517562.1 hypothetical protein [Ignavibacteria bacterium]